MKNNNLISLAPSYEAEDVKIYKPYLDKAILEKEYENSHKYKNKNIAISGGFGAGKSSVIKSYIKNSQYKNKTLYVSLGSYIEQNKPKLESGEIKDIEISILQQIIYSVRPDKIPFSRIARIDKDKNVIIIWSLLTSIIANPIICFIFNIICNKKILELENGTTIMYTLCTITFFAIWFMFYYILSRFNFNSINLSISDIKASANNTEELSILNKYIDELVYFFLNTDYEIIVFEDIDRLNECQKIFSKLKEINAIINIAINNKTIRFIYAVGDTIFDSGEKRTKFFDIIIPIIPYAGDQSTKDIFKKELEEELKCGLDLTDFRIVGSFTDNARKAYEIINEYRIFKQNINDENKLIVKQLFYMSAYKVLYPQEFELLYYNKGLISFFITKEFRKDCVYYIKEKRIKATKNRLDKLKELEKDIIEKYIKEFLLFLKNKYTLNENDILSFYDKNDAILTTTKEIEDNPERFYKILDNEIYSQYEGNILDEEELFSFMEKNKIKELIESQGKKEQQLQIEYEISSIENENINYNTLESFEIKEYLYYLSESREDKLNEFEKVLIEYDLVNQNTKKIIMKQHKIVLNDTDEEVLERIIIGEIISWNSEIVNPSAMIDEIGTENFILDSMCQKKLYEEILKRENSKEFINSIFENITPYKILTIANIEESGVKFISNIGKNINKIWNVISKSYLADDKNLVHYYVYKTIKEISPSLLEKNSPFYNYVTSEEGILDILEQHYNEIEYKLLDFDITFKSSVIFSKKNPNMLNLIYENNMFEKNFNQIQELCEHLGIDYDINKILESILSNKSDNNVKKMISYNIEDTINIILKRAITQKDSDEFLVGFIAKNNLDEDTFEKLIKIEETKFSDISSIDKKYYELLKEHNKIIGNWHNIYNIFVYNEQEIDDYLLEFIEENKFDLSTDEFDHDKYLNLCGKIVKNNAIDNETYKIINKSVMNNRIYTTIDGIPIEKLKIQIEDKKIVIKDIEKYNVIINNEELSDIEKASILINSFDYLENKKIDNMNNIILNEILESDLLDQKKIDFILRHKETFNEEFNEKVVNFIINNELKINNNDIYSLLSNLKNENKKIKFIIKNKKILEEYDIDDILNIIGGNCIKILNREYPVYFDNNEYCRDFLDILASDDYKKIDHYDITKNFLQVAYNKKKNKKNS